MLPESELHVRVSRDAPDGEESPDKWWRADVVLNGVVVATGFAKQMLHDDQDQAVRAEACTIATNMFERKIKVKEA